MNCPSCGASNAEEAKFCIACGAPLTVIPMRDVDSAGTIKAADVRVVEALKTPNTACLWVSLDYWNLYFSGPSVIAVRCHRGWWGLTLFIIGLFMAVVPGLITGALGILWDKSVGEAKCRSMRKRLDEILANRSNYEIVEASLDKVSGTMSSDMCLGSIWLKHRIQIAGKSFYFEEAKYEEMESVVPAI